MLFFELIWQLELLLNRDSNNKEVRMFPLNYSKEESIEQLAISLERAGEMCLAAHTSE